MNRSLRTELKSKLNLAGIPKPAVVGIAALMVVILCFVVGKLIAGPSKTRAVLEPSVATALAAQPEEDVKGTTIFVHVSGAVEKPGLFELEAQSRVASAIEAAGGFTDDADMTSVNLARVLSDGEQLFISSTTASVQDPANPGGSGGAGSFVQLQGGATSSSQQGNTNLGAQPQGSTSVSGKVNINTATQSQLTALPGIGDSTASKIINDRTANGPFKKIEDLTRVSGIGDKKFEALRDLICV